MFKEFENMFKNHSAIFTNLTTAKPGKLWNGRKQIAYGKLVFLSTMEACQSSSFPIQPWILAISLNSSCKFLALECKCWIFQGGYTHLKINLSFLKFTTLPPNNTTRCNLSHFLKSGLSWANVSTILTAVTADNA